MVERRWPETEKGNCIMVTTLSDSLTNAAATPQALGTSGSKGGRVRVACDAFETTATVFATAGDIILLERFPTSAIILDIEFMNDDLDGTADVTADVGIYDTDSAQTVKVIDVFASDLTMFQAAVTTWTSVFDESAVFDVANAGKQLWEHAGDSVKPANDRDYFIAITCVVDAASDQAGTLAYKITYVLD